MVVKKNKHLTNPLRINKPFFWTANTNNCKSASVWLSELHITPFLLTLYSDCLFGSGERPPVTADEGFHAGCYVWTDSSEPSVSFCPFSSMHHVISVTQRRYALPISSLLTQTIREEPSDLPSEIWKESRREQTGRIKGEEDRTTGRGKKSEWKVFFQAENSEKRMWDDVLVKVRYKDALLGSKEGDRSVVRTMSRSLAQLLNECVFSGMTVADLGFETFHCDSYTWDGGFTLCCDPVLLVSLAFFSASERKQSTQGHRWSRENTVCVHICEHKQQRRRRGKRNEHTRRFTVNNVWADWRTRPTVTWKCFLFMTSLSPTLSDCKLHRSCREPEIMLIHTL